MNNKDFYSITISRKKLRFTGQMLVELVMAIGIAAIILPALLTGLVTSRQGRPQQQQSLQATELFKETANAVREVRDNSWTTFAVDGTYHPTIVNNAWTLASGSATTNGFTQQVVIGDVYRDTSGNIVSSGGTLDPSTKKVVITVSWSQPQSTTLSATDYLTRTTNLTHTETTTTDFNAGTLTQAQVTNTAGGEVELANDNRGKWCSPAFSSASIDLPDGPPVAVAATASASTNTIPNDVFAAVAPTDSISTKLAYLNVTANTDPPVPSLIGTWTMDSTKYSAGTFPSGTGLTNSFATNDVKYYTSPSGNLYALLATDDPAHELMAIQIKNNGSNSYQDSVNKIFKYWTYFNTKMYGTAFNNPSANAAVTSNAGDNNGYQTNPTKAYVNDGSFATDTSSGTTTTTGCTDTGKDKHDFYNYDFNIPSGATINGIEIDLVAKVDSTTGTPKMCVQISGDGGSTWSTAQSTASLTTSSATYVLGGTNNLWGKSWTSTNFSNTNFRVRVSDVASSTSRTFSLDWVGAKVYSNSTTTTSNDQDPFGYGAASITVLGNTGYVDSGGYLYAFDLSNIDGKSSSSDLDQIGCRVLLDGYDCKPGSPNSTVEKYNQGETGSSTYSDTSSAANTCSDGGKVELNADEQLSSVQVGSNKYVYVAVGGASDPELDIVDVSTPPTGSTLSNNTCGRGTNTGWKVTGTLDFNSATSTQESANSVYAKSDGTRAYMSSNGGIDANHDSKPDSDQFYVIDSTNKSSPKFLSGTSSTGAQSGYYNGDTNNIEMYPRRALTVQDGLRAIIVGQDGLPNDSITPQNYQVLDLSTESTPNYCGGLDFSSGFNDLTSVSEADGDNYVYLVANTAQKQLKIIEGGPDNAIYDSSGTFESKTFDTASVDGSTLDRAFNRLLSDISQPTNTTIKIQTAVAPAVNNSCTGVTFNYVGPDGTSNSYFTPSGSTISGIIPLGDYIPASNYDNPGRCFRYKVYLSTLDQTITPKLLDLFVNYSQ
ncbi:MAG TPA: hypothetical protein VLF93_06065 [Candidatus Saccharimonadales bacterium]|nr:hypothetical protein [Candidatus Saccharimonadales bacterium]